MQTIQTGLLGLVVLACLTGCATRGAGDRHLPFQNGVATPDLSQDGGGFGFWEKGDDFQLLQQSAGLEEDSWHEVGEELETDDAQALWETLARTGTTLQSFGPRRSLAFLLRQVRTRDEDVPYAELSERLRPFHFLVVMRPDGYLVSALTGRPLQRMWKGRVELREGRLMVGTFEVGAFYRDKGGVFYTVDDSLTEPGVMVGELGLERDWFNAALDGGGDALGEMAQALAHFVNDPIRSLKGLEQLPSAVAALIASSPDYFARYSALPVQEQIREAARLATHLMMLYGSAAGTATRIGTAGARLPVLSLSAEGALAIEQVALPVGATAAAVGTGAGAVYVLMESTKDPDEGGQAQASGAAKEAGGGFKPFMAGNFRENLARCPLPLSSRSFSSAESWHVSMDSKSTTKVFPGFDKIFWLRGAGSRRPFRGGMAVETDGRGLTRAEVHPSHPIAVEWAMGSAKPGEVMWTTHGEPIVVSDSVVQLLRSHGFTGWSLYEVSVRDKQGQLSPGHSGLAVTGRCGNIDWAQGIEVPRIFPAGIFPVWKGLFFDPASWDGSDFFMDAEGAGYVFVVEDVKKAFERAKIRNVKFQPLDQFERSWKI